MVDSEYVKKLQAVCEKHLPDIYNYFFFEKELEKEITYLNNQGYKITFEEKQRSGWFGDSDYFLATFCEIRKGVFTAIGFEGGFEVMDKYSALVDALKNFVNKFEKENCVEL